MYLVTASEMQAMDRRTIESFGLPGRILMENAGRGATAFLLELFPDIGSRKVGVIAGRGNNGGDGYVIARCLAHRGVDVTVFLLTDREHVSGDAAANLELLSPLGVPVVEIPDPAAFDAVRVSMRNRDLWVDAILGTGLRSEVRGYFRELIDFINSLGQPVFAVDVPSGLNADTGQPCGSCIRAYATVTFGFAKTGHFQFPGTELSGKLQVIDIGIPPHVVEEIAPRQFLLRERDVKNYINPRPPDSHKGRTGHLLVVAGAPGKTGAAALAALAAMRAGAGLVTLAAPRGINPILASTALEVMTAPLPEIEGGRLGMSAFESIRDLLNGKRCLAVGPGMGQAPETRELLRRLVLESNLPLVIDADGLNNLAGATAILGQRTAPVVLTPHPGEMARLAETTVAAVQKDRIACAREFARTFKVHLVLKGAHTVIAHPDGFVFINPTGNSGMASGGMGDVLTGLIAGLITQGLPVEAACHLGVYLHGAAADRQAVRKGPWGYLAAEVISGIPSEIRRCLEQ